MLPEQILNGAGEIIHGVSRIRENRTIRRAVGTAWRIYAMVAIAGAPIIGTEMITRGAISRSVRGTFNNIVSPPTPKPENPTFMHNSSGEIIFPANDILHGLIDQTIKTYDSWQGLTQSGLQRLLEQRQPDQVFQTLEQVSMNFLQEGVSILQIAWLEGLSRDKVVVDSDQRNLWINEERFDLTNRFEKQLVSSVIQTKVLLVDNKLLNSASTVNSNDANQKEREAEGLQEDLAGLNWLKQHLPEIDIQDGSVVFIQRNKMVEIARLVQAFEKMGVKYLAPITWCEATCVENGLANGAASPFSGTTTLDSKVDVRILAHEWAHTNFLSLLPKFTAIRGVIIKPQPEDRFKYITEYAMINTWEDFADTFSYYVTRGDYFRSLLEEIKVQDPESYKVLKRKYDFMRDDVARGLEFTDGGRILSVDEKQKEEEFTGLFWNPQNRVLTVRPNPGVFPGRTISHKVIPIIDSDKEIHDVVVWLNLRSGEVQTIESDYSTYSSNTSYVVDVYGNASFIEAINAMPLPGNDRVYVFNKYDKPVRDLVKLGAVESIILTPDKSQKDPVQTIIHLEIKSRPPIQKGQQRRVLEAPPIETWKPKEPISGYYVEKVTVLNDFPRIKENTKGDRVMVWDVELREAYGVQEARYYGEIPDNLIGEEVVKKPDQPTP